jgi:hypothetical protein
MYQQRMKNSSFPREAELNKYILLLLIPASRKLEQGLGTGSLHLSLGSLYLSQAVSTWALYPKFFFDFYTI